MPSEKALSKIRKNPALARTQRDLAKALAVPSGRSSGGSAVEHLLSGKTLRSGAKAARSGESEKKVEQLPKEIAELADIVAAGRKIEREISFKLEYANKGVRDYCRRRFAQIFAATGSRRSSMAFAGKHSSFTFIQTRRMSINEEKVHALNAIGFDVSSETELRGIRINYEAIQRNKLEQKLRAALEGMNVSREVLAECFQPDVQLRESFFDRLGMLTERSLAKGESLGEKLYEVLNILNPTEQIRNADLPDLSSIQSYKLVHDSQIAEIGDERELEDE